MCQHYHETSIDQNWLKLLLQFSNLVKHASPMSFSPLQVTLLLMHSQLLEGLKCESQTENSGRVKSRGTLPGLQHFGGVEGRARTSGWDQEELTSFTHSHKPAQNQRKVVNAQLEHLWCQDEPRATWTHKIHHGPDLGEATTFPLIVYFVPLHGTHIQMAFCPKTAPYGSPEIAKVGTSQLWGAITLRANLELR